MFLPFRAAWACKPAIVAADKSESVNAAQETIPSQRTLAITTTHEGVKPVAF
jgi:hypothetical protein